MVIGVLGIQGDYAKHQEMLTRLEVESKLVRTPQELSECKGLIIPGGESTTMVKQLKEIELFEPLRAFGKSNPVFGTCAGLILLSQKVLNHPVDSLQLIDIEVERNAYGRQIDSFIDMVDISLNGTTRGYEGVFIRAPKIKKIGEQVKVLARHGEEIVMAEEGNVLVATFHPELTDDPSVHQYFVKKVHETL